MVVPLQKDEVTRKTTHVRQREAPGIRAYEQLAGKVKKKFQGASIWEPTLGPSHTKRRAQYDLTTLKNGLFCCNSRIFPADTFVPVRSKNSAGQSDREN